ncbi:carbamoyltransferase family protein [Bailinhaonella thermotolerans]|uniref:carbamoyltransferase family protein n=1 Tax=Bailinhaonella thermotolerans TaxID=1070861 RepID=UPI001F5B9979|nr:carbamoyltransferase C-terminal domain-containing protein [Bailinhaonella thermotolerans]
MSAPAVVLGLCSGTHDSAAALLVDGELVGLVEEERLNGIKHTSAYPAKAITWLLSHAGIPAAHVTDVAYNFSPPGYLAGALGAVRHLAVPSSAGRALARARSFTNVYRRARDRVTDVARRFPQARMHAVRHHLAHGRYAFAASGYPQAAVLIVDSLGETATTTIASARGNSYRTLHTIRDPASLGYAYGAITEHLGWRRGDEEGTVMALAALGDPARFREVAAAAIPLTHNGFQLDPRLLPLRVLSSCYPRVSTRLASLTCPARQPSEGIEQVHADVAAAFQERTEQVMLHLARHAAHRTGQRRLCLGGGVAMNCVSVGRIAERAGFDEVFVPPAPGDSGTAAGAALAVHAARAGDPATGVAGRCYLGPAFPGLTLAETPRPNMVARRLLAPTEVVADRLAEGQIVGVFHGALEAGPRALGNRSILASPLLPDVVRRLNETVKFREPFRPFAPAVLAEHAPKYFTLRQASPYMSVASPVTAAARKIIPSVVHVNGTARVQTVTWEANPFLAGLLEAFAARTGVPVLINTSLNIKGKPICGTPDMALDCLAESGLDALLLDDWWVTRT